MTTVLESLTVTIIPSGAGVYLAVVSPTDMGVIIGAACAGAGIAGALGMLMSEAIPSYYIPKLPGLKRLAANWLCGLCSIPFANRVHRNWFPDEELSMVAAGLAAVVALLGVSIFMIAIPMLLQKARAKVGYQDPVEPAPAVKPLAQDAPTVRLAPPDKTP